MKLCVTFKIGSKSEKINNVIDALTSKNYFRSYYVVSSDSHLHIVKFNFLGKILGLVPYILGKQAQYIQWAGDLKGKVFKVFPKETGIKIMKVKLEFINSTTDVASPESFKNYYATRNELFKKFSDSSVSDEELYQFLKTKNITAQHTYFSQDTFDSYADAFAEAKNQTIEEFISNYEIKDKSKEWEVNFSAKNLDANELILLGLICNKNISDKELYQFMISKKLTEGGGFFNHAGQPTQAAHMMVMERNQDVKSFFKANANA